MIVLDTTVLAYAVGAEHPMRDPCRQLVAAVRDGRLEARTTHEVIQEFAHVYARRRTRKEAISRARSYATLLAPLLSVDDEDLDAGLKIYGTHDELGSFDSILAALAVRRHADALVSGDPGFGVVEGLRWVDPRDPALAELMR